MKELEAATLPALSEEGQRTDYEMRKEWKALWKILLQTGA